MEVFNSDLLMFYQKDLFSPLYRCIIGEWHNLFYSNHNMGSLGGIRLHQGTAMVSKAKQMPDKIKKVFLTNNVNTKMFMHKHTFGQ